MTNLKYTSILEGNLFMVSDERGDVSPSTDMPTGLFGFDMRYLSVWNLTVNGERLSVLSVDDLQYFESRYFLVPGEPTHYVDASMSVIRQRRLGGGAFVEQLTVLNHQEVAVDLRVRLDIATDFADSTEYANVHKKGKISTAVEQDTLHMYYTRENQCREVVITSSAEAAIDDHGMTFDISVGPHGSWETVLQLIYWVRGIHGRDIRVTAPNFDAPGMVDASRVLAEWLAAAPTLSCDSAPLDQAYRRSLTDLAALRFTGNLRGEQQFSAGLPWMMGLQGRDSIVTCLQLLPFIPSMVPNVLHFLADAQGTRLDDFAEEEPGKILQEFRFGERAGFGEIAACPYYGAADTTPLFVILLDAYDRWTGDTSIAQELEFHTRRALRWIDEYGDIMGDGYLWYARRNDRLGVENQCWKDTPDAISYRDGRLPVGPRATCELQGYAYDAKRRGARLAREVWNDPAYAAELEAQAAELKRRFNQRFWIRDGRYYALGVDADGNHVDACASNMGHLLWSGIVDPDKARHVVKHLMSERLFTGWGIRTLAEGDGRYSPVGFHTGAIWPFDNALIAHGMRQYGFHQEAARVAGAIIDASEFFDGRLPSAFAGYDRKLTKYPVQLPAACSPHSWSAGAVLMFLCSMLGLDPKGEHLIVRPHLPRGIGRIELLDLPGRWGLVDVFGRGH
ncbi:MULTISPECIES: glycogen debranching N-terminal domain-containing protein [unclassified Solwaraspora]|uniref:amylo-alpha-1,6-glucosidase n=1 Tax=unclassified Solwaraspora TaxID=2627926 RepID=UPI00248A9817|nr:MULTISPECIES: glycogen debranching N-terminal domain-containing protein [unclassified Solwaraspora]WBB98820.1 amylo-alpha-1,6-glucosidase [Solwaraspora sp. WMMA2059]WBC22627.1 amylo-alpha-1,6-glucosidase [Solwaraspora sp. WMMA2080]WJK35323.1 glycogen debranching N-terminal domain-containing protein [Solwaraspora sp. WMMA2065]